MVPIHIFMLPLILKKCESDKELRILGFFKNWQASALKFYQKELVHLKFYKLSNHSISSKMFNRNKTFFKKGSLKLFNKWKVIVESNIRCDESLNKIVHFNIFINRLIFNETYF